MKDELLVITDTVLARILKGFAMRMGCDDGFADVLAQVHVQTTDTHKQWSEFLQSNCSTCTKEPGSCELLHPTEKNIVGNKATPLTMRHANMTMVEMGRYTRCPAYVPLGEEDEQEE